MFGDYDYDYDYDYDGSNDDDDKPGVIIFAEHLVIPDKATALIV